MESNGLTVKESSLSQLRQQWQHHLETARQHTIKTCMRNTIQQSGCHRNIREQLELMEEVASALATNDDTVLEGIVSYALISAKDDHHLEANVGVIRENLKPFNIVKDGRKALIIENER